MASQLNNYDFFNGKNYLIVGASSGIGNAISKQLATLGANLSLISRRKEKLLTITKLYPTINIQTISFDISNLNKIATIYNKVQCFFDKLDGFVFSAGIGDTCRLKDLNPSRLLTIMTINFLSYVEFVRQIALTKKIDDHLSIVAISSLASIMNDKHYTAYSASKAALDSASRCLATELLSKRIRINTIRPGVVDVERIREMEKYLGDMDQLIKNTNYQPQGLIPVKDVVSAALFLLGPSSQYITGTHLSINGGAIN